MFSKDEVEQIKFVFRINVVLLFGQLAYWIYSYFSIKGELGSVIQLLNR
jgi:hypothetical protein